VIMANPSEVSPLNIEDFVDSIDTRGGFYQGVAKSIENFNEELSLALLGRNVERKILERNLAEKSRRELELGNTLMHPNHVQYVQQLVSALLLPPLSLEEHKEKYYLEEQRNKGTIEQDELMPHIDKFLQDKRYKPTGISEKKYTRLLEISKRFVRYEGRIYRRGKDTQHRLYENIGCT